MLILKKNAGPKSIGKGRKDPPPYYNLLHSAFAEKHTVKPPVAFYTPNISSIQNEIMSFGEELNESNELDSPSMISKQITPSKLHY